MTAIENVDTDNKDRPIEEILIQKATVFVDPFTEADEQVNIFDLYSLKTLEKIKLHSKNDKGYIFTQYFEAK